MTLDRDEGDDLIDLPGRVGKAGELAFDGLTNGGGGVANKVGDDRLGWDFHVQLARSSDWATRYSLDTRPPEASCFVQVKATTRSIRSWALKLSTWERLAKERRPVFFVVFMFDKEDLDRPRRGYVVHLGEELLSLALKTLRKVPDEKANELNHRELSFTWTKDDELPNLTGHELIAAIQRHIGPDIGTYEAKKAELLKTLGYDEGRFKMSFQVSREHTREEIAAFTLGLRSGIKGEITRSVESRFEIEKHTTSGPPLGEVEIQLPGVKPDARGFAIFEGCSSGERVRIPCDIYSGRGFAPVLLPQQRGLRVVFEGAELTLIPQSIEENRITLTQSFSYAYEAAPLAQAARTAKVLNLLAEPAGCQLGLESGGTRIGSMINLKRITSSDNTLYAEIILCTARLAAAAELDPNIHIEATKLLQQSKALLIAGTKRMMTVRGRTTTSSNDSSAPTVLLLPNQVHIEPYCVTSVIGITGVAQIDSATGNFEITGQPEIIKISTTEDETNLALASELRTAAVAEVQRRGLANLFHSQGVLEVTIPEETSVRVNLPRLRSGKE